MAAFSSYHHGPFMVPDSVYVPNTSSNNMSTSSAITITCFPPIYPNRYLHQSPLKQVSESASMAPELESGDEATQVVTQLEKTRKAMASEVGGGGQCEKGKKFANGMSEIVEEKKLKAGRRKDKKKVSEEAPPTGYVHVRARRGQATDSHSLAERVRREKISERMKLLQSLVPGCDRITGKALILDEIINYVQSLQNQVEFLVKKLASIYPNFFNYLDANSPAPALERLPGNSLLVGPNTLDKIMHTIANLCKCSMEEAKLSYFWGKKSRAVMTCSNYNLPVADLPVLSSTNIRLRLLRQNLQEKNPKMPFIFCV
ncbi:hypothetical protein NMG60_11024642 [Bertholletia excelsa]